jgi:hypothetical protein
MGRYESYLRVFKLDISRVSAQEDKFQASMYYFVYYINISLKSRKKIVEIAD